MQTRGELSKATAAAAKYSQLAANEATAVARLLL
jgi:hypothetical protein